MVGVAFAVRHPERCAQLICDLGRAAPRRLGHGDPPPAARARARRPAQRRRRHRHEPRAAARHAHLPRPRRARHAVRHARTRARAAAGRRVPRAPRPALRRALPGARRSCSSARRSIAAPIAESADRAEPRSSASPPRPSSSACPATCCSRGRCRRSCIASCRRPARTRRCGSSIRCTATTRSSPIRTSSPNCCAARGAFGARATARRGRGSRASARSPCARSGSAWSAAAPSARGLLELIDAPARPRWPSATACGSASRRIAVRDRRQGAQRARAAGIPLTDAPLDLVSDPDVDVVVEVAGGDGDGAGPAAALAAGKPVVTANKALLASKLAELGVLAQRTATPLYCEAAAAAALPIIRHLCHRADEVDSLAGIVNGTCNFIITRIEQDELPLDRAIARGAGARASPRPTRRPTSMGTMPRRSCRSSPTARSAPGSRPMRFPVRGIRELGPADCDLAEAMGFRIRLIAHAAARIDGALDMAVEPVLLPDWHLLASVEEEYNAVYLHCASSGDLSLFGKGAGALPTATAVLGDLIDLAQDNSVHWPEPRRAIRARGPGGAPRAAPPLPARHRRAAPGPASASREPGAPRRPDGPEPRAPRRGAATHLGVHDLASPDARDRDGASTASRSSDASSSALARSRRMSVAPSTGCDPADALPRRERPPLAAMGERHARSCTTASTRTRDEAACPICIPTSPPSSGPLRLGAGHRVAGRQGGVPVRRRRLLVGAAAPLCALRHDRHRRS